jgi:CHAD domain-containing protein
VKARRVRGLDPSEPVRASASLIVATRLAELRGFAETALAPDAGSAQHDLRIAAKRLRYVLEVLGPCIGGEAEAAREACKRLQSALGDLHDCDLMLRRTEGIESVAALLVERRARFFGAFVEIWQDEAGNGTWSALERRL